jgi:hypothetical protein
MGALETRSSPRTMIACSLSERELAERSETLQRELFALAEEIVELEDGYAYRFADAADWPATLIEFATAERRCCAFFRIEIVFEPGLGPIWLHLRGPAGVKDFIRNTFSQGIASKTRPSTNTYNQQPTTQNRSP